MSASTTILGVPADERAQAEAASWKQFLESGSQPQFCASWLSILCGQIDRATGAVLLLGPEPDGAFVPAALWPDASHDLQHLQVAAERALSGRRGFVMPSEAAANPVARRGSWIGYPVELAGVLRGAVVVAVEPCPDELLQRSLRAIHWASAWLTDRLRQAEIQQRDRRIDRIAVAMDVAATALQQRQFGAAALAVANDLANRLQCERVSLGFVHGGRIKVQALSHTATFDARMGLVRAVRAAMEEVLDLETAIVHPAPPADVAALAHAQLAREYGDTAICSVPLMQDGDTIGVLTFERSAGPDFGPRQRELCQTIGVLLGPILQLQRDNERGVGPRIVQGAGRFVRAVFGPGHAGLRLLLFLAAAVVAGAWTVHAPYRVVARTVVEGAVQRAAVAPFDGHVAQSLARAGDVVREGQPLARLDDRELRLERVKLVSEREQTSRRARQALAQQDRSLLMQLSSQISQLDAQVTLVEDKLARATLVAPFDGVVVSGDLSQLLGAPVELGKVLFQLAPLDAYRVILEVDEREIAEVKLGQTGELVLSGLSDQRVAFAVQQITPVATAMEGRNFFRVEAHMLDHSDRVRPGMEGVGKIAIDERNLLWIWTHSLFDWLRAWAWKWLP